MIYDNLSHMSTRKKHSYLIISTQNQKLRKNTIYHMVTKLAYFEVELALKPQPFTPTIKNFNPWFVCKNTKK